MRNHPGNSIMLGSPERLRELPCQWVSQDGGRKIRGVAERKICVRARDMMKNRPTIFRSQFSSPTDFGGKCVRLNLNINRARCWDLYQAAVSASRRCICICIRVFGGIMSYCGSQSALAAGSDRFAFVYNFHALRFSRSSFSRSAFPLPRWKIGERKCEGNFVIVYVFWQDSPRSQFARQFGAKHTATANSQEAEVASVASCNTKCLAEVVMSAGWGIEGDIGWGTDWGELIRRGCWFMMPIYQPILHKWGWVS